MIFLVLAVTVRGRAALEVLKAGTPCTACPEKDERATAEGATVGVARNAVAVAAMAARWTSALRVWREMIYGRCESGDGGGLCIAPCDAFHWANPDMWVRLIHQNPHPFSLVKPGLCKALVYPGPWS